MSRARNKQFKANLAQELRTAAETLKAARLIRDSSPLRLAAEACTGSKPTNNYWRYSFSDLEFIVGKTHLEKYRHTIPGNLVEIRVHLSVRAKGLCLDDDTDPFEELVVDCKIEGRKKNNSVPYISAWHLDRNEGDSDDASQNFIHPLYHFQFGGDKLPRDWSYGRFLFVESPRLVHPPLDAVLAIDFVLTNYFPVTWREIRADNVRYSRIIQQAQQRCWRPYAKSSSTAWLPGNHPWTAYSIWPQLIRRT